MMRQKAFTILEMLLAMIVLGVILAVAANLLQSNQRVTEIQQTRTSLLEDARMAASRLSETINQAAYIYPAGLTIQVDDGLTGRGTANTVTTGADALALLLPDAQNNASRTYHGVIFYRSERSAFQADLPDTSKRSTPWVLVEARSPQTGVGAIVWNQNKLPTTRWLTNMDEGVLVDSLSVNATDPNTSSSLMGSASYSTTAGIDEKAFQNGIRAKNPSINNPNALILGISFQLAVQVTPIGSNQSAQITLIRGLGTARNVPRR